MEENVVLKVTLHKDGGIEIHVGSENVAPLTLVGILEQVKYNILSNSSPMEEQAVSGNTAKYDA
jgi:hypothetical protein